MSLKEVLKHVERQLCIIVTWADRVEAEKKVYDEELNRYDKEHSLRLRSFHRFRPIHYHSPGRRDLYDVLEQRLKEVPRKKAAKALIELRQLDPKLATLQTMLLERYRSGSAQVLVSQLSQLQLLSARVAQGLDSALRSNTLGTLPWEAREISRHIQKARAVIEQIKWAALDLLFGSPNQSND